MEQHKPESSFSHNVLVEILQQDYVYIVERFYSNNIKREQGNHISLRDIVIPNKVILPYKEQIEHHYTFFKDYGRES